MKKAAPLALLLGVLLLGLLFAATGGGEAAKPIATPTTVEHAEEYFGVANEIGTPWDLAMLVDTMYADMLGKPDILDVNPLRTNLDFAYLVVTIKTKSRDEDGAEETTTREEYYYGYYEIRSLLGLTDKSTVSDVFAAMKEYDKQKSKGNTTYSSAIFSAPYEEYRAILEKYYLADFEEYYGEVQAKKLLDDILELYDSRYLYYLYFEEIMKSEGADFSDYEMPEVVVGSATRQELVEVALSLINRPYLFGGKSAHVGAPRSLLDCSGFVDWAYVQCFGADTTVSNGGGTTGQFHRSTQISERELKPGDLGFYYDPASIPAGEYNHVGIYIGEIGGKPAFVHCGGPYWGTSASPSGRVVVSINDRSTVNTQYSPAMNPSNFVIFMRPPYQFAGDEPDDVGEEEEG